MIMIKEHYEDSYQYNIFCSEGHKATLLLLLLLLTSNQKAKRGALPVGHLTC